MNDDAAILWRPTAEERAAANLTAFMDQVRKRHQSAARIVDYESLHRWSIAHPEELWPEVWRFCGVVADSRPDGTQWDEVLIGRARMAPPDPELGPKWFTGARLNFAENLLRHAAEGAEREAIVSWDERGARARMTYGELLREVERVAAALRERGVRPGDRVAALMPNIPETVVAMLAAASIGAIWSSCSPDFGAAGVLDRFGQIAPKVLFCTDGYRYAEKEIDLLGRIREVVDALPDLECVILVSHLRERVEPEGIRSAVYYEDLAGAAAPGFVRLPFDHPLYIMYSSGTTGLPKCMVHGAGGTLLQHLKELVLHTDLRPASRIFYFTTCGWMMWNWLVSSLAAGATVVLYDGSPLPPHRKEILWDMAEAERIEVFGTSAKWLALSEKEGLRPRKTHQLGALRSILSTGSPLAPHSFDYVHGHVKERVRLSSISGGTDIISCFALGNPLGPVHRGEIQAVGLGMKVEVFGESGEPLTGEAGELVCTMPFPSMPIYFWNDPSGRTYRAAYFDHYPNAWRHGDWAELTPSGGMIIHGRSDATLNPGGVRIGTAEIYRQVETIAEVLESVAVGQESAAGEAGDERIVLFVRLADGVRLDESLESRIRTAIRANVSPHHVPKLIVQVSDIPRTISGKISELAVREAIHGRPVKNVDALANPASLGEYRALSL